MNNYYALLQLLEIARETRYSDEYVGNAVRANLAELSAEASRLVERLSTARGQTEKVDN